MKSKNTAKDDDDDVESVKTSYGNKKAKNGVNMRRKVASKD